MAQNPSDGPIEATFQEDRPAEPDPKRQAELDRLRSALISALNQYPVRASTCWDILKEWDRHVR